MSIAKQEDIEEINRQIKSLQNQLGNMPGNIKSVLRGEITDNSKVVEQSRTQFGLYTALCVETIDIWKQNRIRWYSPLFHKPNMRIGELPWAHAVSPFGGFDDCGATWVPPAGSTVCILFENGNRASPFYIGTTWHRNRGPDGTAHNWGFAIQEYYDIWEGKRGGYLVGPNDGSQVFPPWNTENYNGYDLNSVVDFAANPEAQRLISYPNIYGFKTPEKHAIKMVDGDPSCNRKWKRFELMSSCGNWIMMKDDHLHYAGQWAHPSCGGVVRPGEVSCAQDAYTQNEYAQYLKGNGSGASSSGQDSELYNIQRSNEGYPTVIYSVEDTGIGIGETADVLIMNSGVPGMDGSWPGTGVSAKSFSIPFNNRSGTISSGKWRFISNTANGGSSSQGGLLSSTNIRDGTPKKGEKLEETSCEEKRSNNKIIGGHPSTSKGITKYYKSQVGSNPFFKHRQECRPYKGAPTPQNNQCDLPQSGIQIMSISGHTFVMDDSVEEPSGEPTWDREFDFGCNNHYVGRTYWKSATGHLIEMSDIESPQGDDGANLRGQYNYIKILSASGNKIELNDHTESKPDCVGCPPNIAGSKRGIHLQSTSNHTIDMVDEANEQCAPCRTEGGVPIPKAKKAYMAIRSGYGLEISLNDDSSQEETQNQNIKIFAPQKDNEEKGPHIMLFQESPSGPGLVMLRVGGDYICQTVDNHFTIVGTEEDPADLEEVVTGSNLVYTKENYTNISDATQAFLANDMIMLLAGKDRCPNMPDDYIGPIPAPVLVYDGCTGAIRISDRVIASTSPNAPCVSIFQLSPFNKECK